MSDAPKTIYCKEGHNSWSAWGHWYTHNKGGGIEYTRTDIHLAEIAEAERRGAEKEREACAAIADQRYEDDRITALDKRQSGRNDSHWCGGQVASEAIATAIRNRGNDDG